MSDLAVLEFYDTLWVNCNAFYPRCGRGKVNSWRFPCAAVSLEASSQLLLLSVLLKIEFRGSKSLLQLGRIFLYAGFNTVARITLARANDRRDRRIYQDFAMVLIEQARALQKIAIKKAIPRHALNAVKLDFSGVERDLVAIGNL